jgi:Poly(ADP-ribose) polymerase catalytic domain
MSEIDSLIKLLEYAINSKASKPVETIINEMILFKATIDISYKISYKCSSHMNYYGKSKSYESKTSLSFFPCDHIVCDDCLRSYIEPLYIKVGKGHTYVCPGCISDLSSNKIIINPIDNYIAKLFDKNQIEEVENRILTITNATLLNRPQPKVVQCYYLTNPGTIPCSGQYGPDYILLCNHPICLDCLKTYLYNHKDQEEEIKCFYPRCPKFIQHKLIRKAIENNPELSKIYWRRLKINGEVNLECANGHPFLASSNERTARCNTCGEELCTNCAEKSHEGITCFVAKQKSKEYQLIECIDDEIYKTALHKFEWDLNEKTKKQLREQFKFNCKLNKVFYVNNPLLLEKYEKAKKNMMDNGVPVQEMYLYHSTKLDVYEKICKEGFLIGGKDVEVAVGKLYGLGIYTATDASYSIKLYKKLNKILLCKGLVGRISPQGIGKVADLSTTQYHCFFQDNKGDTSNFYIFFKSEYVLPYCLIEFT